MSKSTRESVSRRESSRESVTIPVIMDLKCTSAFVSLEILSDTVIPSERSEPSGRVLRFYSSAGG